MSKGLIFYTHASNLCLAKNKFYRSLFKIICSICLILGLSACGDKVQEQAANGKQTIKIGGIFSLSGPQAGQGEAAKAGMLKALSERNQDDLHYNYEFVFEDNQGKLASTPAIANKMIVQDKVDGIAVLMSSFAKTIAPITDANDKLLYSFSMEERDYKRFGKYAFVQGISVEDMVDKMSDLQQKRNVDNVMFLVLNFGVQPLIANYAKERYAQLGIKYEAEMFNPGERDFRIAIERGKAKGFTNFMMIGIMPECDIILKQLLESGIPSKNIFAYSLVNGGLKDFYQGVESVSYDTGSRDFEKNLMSNYNLSTTIGASAYYDMINITIEAYEDLYKEGGKPTAQEITDYIQNKKSYKCMSGICQVRDNGFITNPPIYIVYRDGGWQKFD